MTQLPYMNNRFAPMRRQTLEVRVGNRIIGGNAPILVQSMTTTNTKDVAATVKQTLELAAAGCELVRITAPTQKDSECLRDIVQQVRAAGCTVPISADIHFQPRAAMEAVKWVEKVRINPGNFVDSKGVVTRLYDDSTFAAGCDKVFEAFTPLIREAKSRGVCLRIGTNHGSLSDRMLWKFGDTIEGMVESAMEYLAVCEAENFDQIVFSMKSSNPKVAVQAYRLLAARLSQGHKPYPFHVGVTEAGDGEDGRLKSSVGIGALLLDGIGDTVRVSLTEDPVHEIPVAKILVELCDTAKLAASSVLEENLNFYAYHRRDSVEFPMENLMAGHREKILVGTPLPPQETLPKGERQLEWVTSTSSVTGLSNQAIALVLKPATSVTEPVEVTVWNIVKSSDLIANAKNIPSGALEIVIEDVMHLTKISPEVLQKDQILWSFVGTENPIAGYRSVAAWIEKLKRSDLIVLRGISDGSPEDNMELAAKLGAVLVDGLGDLLHITSSSARGAMHLAYDILQAAGVRKTKPEYVACPSCGRTLFDLQTTTQKIRQRTAHLKNISIAIMGCIVNGPGEMADADFGYVGGAPGKVNLYVGRDCVKKNIVEDNAPEALVNLIKEHGRWVEA